MSTRCQIGIFEKPFEQDGKLNNPEVLIYRHSDGYPENPGVLEPLTNFCKNFIKNRGFDPTYMGARLLPYLISTHTEDLPNQESEDYKGGKKKQGEFGGYLSYGIDNPNLKKGIHGDIEYFYAVHEDHIDIYTTNTWNGITAESFNLVNTVSLA